eukprot:TRINITY_DN2436_c0_g2_i7.p1 TRINITY_DN2436_c0_g2~~TRINITY_DN2436_c0_g2_i7.p1  ORF type:complete len:207 (+),score=40.52 TRINITY_DN2436_c0_g2_i7:859-1479(+)
MNHAWVDRVTRKDPSYFEDLAQHPSKPNFMWIGCSDSRVPANEVSRLRAGEILVHRNIGNVVSSTDLNLLSVLQYAIEVIEVKHVVVTGHYGCRGVYAALQKKDHGLMEHWIRNIRDVRRLHNAELEPLGDEMEQWRRLVELNVREGCMNIMKTGIIQKAWSKSPFPLIHGLVYDSKQGKLEELEIDYQSLQDKYASIYQLQYTED